MSNGFLKILGDVLHFSMAIIWIITVIFVTNYHPIAIAVGFFLICTNVGHWILHFLYVAKANEREADWKALLKDDIKDEVCEELKRELFPDKLISSMKESLKSQR